jgi:ureidoglycolate lyase
MVLAELSVEGQIIHVEAKILTPERFAPYGGILSFEDQKGTVEKQSANYGTAVKLFKVSPVVNNYANAKSGKPSTANLNIFHCSPPNHLITSVSGSASRCRYLSKVLERHPYSTQTFIPMGRNRREISYMVIVARTRQGKWLDTRFILVQY